MTLRDVTAEIAAKVAWAQAGNGVAIHKKWLIEGVLSDHQQIEGHDAAFALCCARFTVEQHVEKYFRTVKQDESDETEQDLLPGFERLQKRYIVSRDGEPMIVKIEDMTAPEVVAKIEQHRAMAAGHQLHANELVRWLKDHMDQRRLSLA